MSTMLQSAYLTKGRARRDRSVTEALVRQYTRDETIPASFYHKGESREFRYAPSAIAVIELMAELGELFGVNSAIPKIVVKQVAPRRDAIWRDPEHAVRLNVLHEGTGVSINAAPLQFLERARRKLVQHTRGG
jgi:hypothetical protein